MTDLQARVQSFREMHHRGQPFLLPNVWDVSSARALDELGFPVIATTSAGTAAVLGFPNRDALPPDLLFPLLARMTEAVSASVTADLESGYLLPPDELAERVLDAGLVGCNLEDTDHHGAAGTLLDADGFAEHIAAVKEAARRLGGDLVVNARADAHVLGLEPADELAEAVRRSRLYLAAGADCVYPAWKFRDEATIRALVEQIPGPVNVVLQAGSPSADRLAALGAIRISCGGELFKRSVAATRAEAEAVLAAFTLHPTTAG